MRSSLALMTIVFGTCLLAMAAQGQDSSSKGSRRYQTGLAAWYGGGTRTANGEAFNPMAHTAAHRTLPFGTRVRVVHRKTGRSVLVRVNDRGTYTKRHVIDLSKGAARSIGLSGVAPVALFIVE
jgi:rare lipoprotein A